MKNKPSIKEIWEKLKTPSPNKYSATQFHTSNLYVIKNSNNSFGIIVSRVTDIIKNMITSLLQGSLTSNQIKLS